MERNFQVVDLVDSSNGRYVGQALYCGERKECPLFVINFNRMNVGEIIEAFIVGAREVGGNVNLTHVNMPIEINAGNVSYNEVRNTVIKEMEIRSERN